MGAINMLGLAKRTGARVLQASTSEVYGDPEIHPAGRRTYWGHVNPIGHARLLRRGQALRRDPVLRLRTGSTSVEIKVARIFNTYGPRMAINDGRVVSQLHRAGAARTRPITIYGEGAADPQSFCYVDDLVEGFIRMMATPAGFTGPVNIGNPNEFTILELAQETIAQIGSSSVIERKPLPQDDPRQRQPDITLAKSALDWEPKTQLKEGLGKTIAHFRALLGKGLVEADA